MFYLGRSWPIKTALILRVHVSQPSVYTKGQGRLAIVTSQQPADQIRHTLSSAYVISHWLVTLCWLIRSMAVKKQVFVLDKTNGCILRVGQLFVQKIKMS